MRRGVRSIKGAPPPTGTSRESLLRLAVSKRGLGLELARTANIGPIVVRDLSIWLDAVTFPTDISGGVERFRHRRGTLDSLTLEVSRERLADWARSQLASLWTARAPEVQVFVRKQGLSVLVRQAAETSGESDRLLAFDVAHHLSGSSIELAPLRARSSDLTVPPTVQAARVLATVLGSLATRQGYRFTIRNIVRTICLNVLPEGGARVPRCDEVELEHGYQEGDLFVVRAARELVAVDPGDVGALEVSRLASKGDHAAFAGHTDAAREHYLEALEHAPLHPELVRRIAEIDVAFAARTEGARAMLTDSALGTDTAGLLLAGQLSARSGDVGGALASFARAADTEIVPSMIAYALGESARLTRDPFEAAAQLARAVALAPASTALRWQNFKLLLRTARLDEARGEAEQLEALTRGPNARASVWRTVAAAFQAEGHHSSARELLERALRYRPDDPSTLLDVGAALLDQNDARALPLLRRASELGTQDRAITARIELLFARAMASLANDIPAALSRLRDAPSGTTHEPEIRIWEARFRHQLGDPQGATVAYAAVRDVILARAAAAPTEAADWLLEAARFERDVRGDLYAARQHLLVGTRASKDDPAIARLLHEVSSAVALATREATFSEAALSEQTIVPSVDSLATAEPAKAASPRSLIAAITIEDEDVAAARVEHLTEQLRADPTHEEVVLELAGLLRALGRSHELLAVLLARVEDAPSEKRETIVQGTCALLEELATEAASAGKDLDASLFRDARGIISS